MKAQKFCENLTAAMLTAEKVNATNLHFVKPSCGPRIAMKRKVGVQEKKTSSSAASNQQPDRLKWWKLRQGTHELGGLKSFRDSSETTLVSHGKQ